MIFILIFFLLSLFFACTGNDVALTVNAILQPPSLSCIQKAFEAHECTFTEAYGKHIQELIEEIFKGNSLLAREVSTSQNSLFSTPVLTCKPCMPSPLSNNINKGPSLYGHLIKQFIEACQSAHISIATQKGVIAHQDEEIESSPILRIAHDFALERVMRLLFLMACPQAHPHERMLALYILNVVRLDGSRGVALERYRERANRFYFTYDGILRNYDPSKTTAYDAKHVKAINHFVKAVSLTKTQYLHLLTLGISYGINLLKPYREEASQEAWSATPPNFMWRYAACVFKQITTIDVIDIRTVTPEKIFAHKANKYFLAVMLHCSLRSGQSREESLKEAYSLISVYKNSPDKGNMLSIMERYYQEACRRA